MTNKKNDNQERDQISAILEANLSNEDTSKELSDIVLGEKLITEEKTEEIDLGKLPLEKRKEKVIELWKDGKINNEKLALEFKTITNPNYKSPYDIEKACGLMSDEDIDREIEDLIETSNNQSDPIVLNKFKLITKFKTKEDNKIKYNTHKRGIEFNFGGYTLLLGGTNSGKTLWASNILCQIMKLQEYQLGFISIEQSREDMMKVIGTNYANVLNECVSGSYSEDAHIYTVKDFEEKKKSGDKDVKDILKEVYKRCSFVFASELYKKEGVSFDNEVALNHIKVMVNNGVKVIIIDYVQDIEQNIKDKNKPFNLQLKDFIREVNNIAMAHNICFIINAQTNSSVATPFFSEKETADSFDIARKATNIYTIWNNSREANAGTRKYNNNKLYSYSTSNEDRYLREFFTIECRKSRGGPIFYANSFRSKRSHYLITNQDSEDGITEYCPFGSHSKEKAEERMKDQEPANDIEAEPAKKINLREKFRGSKNAKH